MDFKVKKEYTVVLSEEEAQGLASDLFNVKMGYRGGSSGASRELLNWLGSRNEKEPSGTDGPPDPNANAEW